MSNSGLAPEWERQDAIVIVWPHVYSDWSTNLANIEATYLEITRHICANQQLIIIAYDETEIASISKKLTQASIDEKNIQLIAIPTNDTWVRDYGPVCICTNKKLKLLNFEFDAWGKKYPYEQDNAFNQAFAKHFKLDQYNENINFVIESGNIDINNQGELLCSYHCFNEEKYPDSNKEDIEKLLITKLQCKIIHWINAGALQGDDTDGHIDTLARFCNDNTIVYSSTADKNDNNHQVLKKLHKQLLAINEDENNKYELIPLPLPKPIINHSKQLPATYTNFLITNDIVLVPTFNDKQDEHTISTLTEVFSTRTIVPIDSHALIQQYGGLHCATMQLPHKALSYVVH